MLVSPEIGVAAVPFLPAIPGCSPVARMTIPAGSCYLRTAVAVAMVFVEVAAAVVVAAFEDLLVHLRSAHLPQTEDIRRPVM